MLLAGWLNEVSGQAANLDQGANGKSTAPDSPVDWINGNLNANQAHFLEGYSVPYRAILTGLTVNQNYTLVIALDVKNSGKHALDYITHFQRLEPHGIFLHAAETVNPLLNITGFPPAYFTSTDTEPIPVPSSAGSPVPGQPSASFNALPAAERVMTGYNADLLSVTYASHGSLTASQSETVINITFKALKETAVLSWGGHIAREADWGSDPITGETNSASAINGSPYHMRLKNWIINGEVVSIGNQDRSLKTDAVFIPPTCEVSGPQEACVSTTSLAFTSTVDNATGLTYLWSIIGSNTAGAKIVNNTLANISVVPIGATFTPGTFNLRLIVTRNGLSDTCYSGSHEAPGLPVTIYQPVVDAGADVSITHLDIASLNATVIGGKSPYTFSWSPATGLSDPNVHNPTFTPPSTGIFQFVVTVTDAAGCTDKDTVVITVTQHADPPCVIDGPDPVCPGSSNVYTGPDPSLVSFFQWSVTGNGTITGDTDKGTVTILAGNTCGPYTIQLITATPDGKVKDTCTRVVQVQDNEKPVLHGSAPDATLGCGKDVPAAPVITATDNCVANITAQMSSSTFDSTCINKFRIVRKWWATDACGNTSDTLTQVITVNDDVKPVISGTYEETVNVSCVGDIPAPPALTANDNCDGLLQPNYTEQGSGSACDSTIVRTWVFTDACGNSASATQTIHLKDAIAPTLVGTAQDANVACSKDIPAPPVITANDNCPAEVKVNFTSTTYDSTCVNKFRIVRKWWAVDGCGNTSDVLTQTIIVNDDVKPVISGTYEETVNVSCVGDIPAPPALTANDNCDGLLQPNYTEQGSGSACDSTIVRTWVFTDACGNSASATQTIHLKDAIAPTLVGTAQDANVACSKDIPAPPVITANDNCPAEVKVNFTSTTYDSTCVNKFRIVRKWWAVDGCGNTSDVLTQTIIVNDDVKPIISGTYEETVNVACVGDIPAPPALTANDNCDGLLQPNYTEQGSGTACDSTIVRTWVFTDACGNSASATQTIHLKDAIAPTLVGTAQDANVTCSKDIPAPPVITANDNCPAEVKVNFTSTTYDSTCVNKFRIVRKWWAVDGCGNTSDVLTQTIVVNDNVKPVITASYEDKIEVKCVGDIPQVPAISAYDNCDGELQPQYSEQGSGTACDSTIVRTWVFTDGCGNTASATQTIHLQDLVPPTLNGTAQNVNVTCSKDIPAPPVITASDNCPAEVKLHFTENTYDSICVNKFRLERTWWAVDGCGNTSEVLTQTIIVNDDVKPIISGTYDETVNVVCVGDIPAPPSITATDNCAGVLQPDYSEEGSGTACDSTIVRTWVFTDGCGNTVTATQTIHLKDLVKPVLNGTAPDATVQCAKDVPAPPAIKATDNCGTAKVYYSETKKNVVCVNRFVLVRKWWAKDNCGNTSDTLYQKVTVYDNTIPVVTNKPADKTLPCGSQPSFNPPSFSDNCGGYVTVVVADRQEGTSCPVTYIRRWTGTDACGNSVWVEQRVRVLCCASYCTYTQGYYGNVNGKACLPGGGTTTAKAIMLGAVDAQPGDSVLFGLKATGKFFTLFLMDVSNDNIFKMLPGGGTPAALKGYTTYSKPATWPLVPISTAASKYGKINNVLLSQTMTLFFNFRVTPGLTGLPIQGTLLMTSKLTACGSTIPVAKVDSFELPKSVVNYLTSIGQSNVGGLFNLANKYLGGQTVTGVTASDVNAAVDAINRGFDKCAVLIGWSNAKLNCAPQVMATGTDDEKMMTIEPETNILSVETYPNPYRDVVMFRFTAPVTGTLQLLIYNLGGQQVDALNKGTVQKGSVHQIRYAVPDAHRSTLIYKLSVGRAEATGKLIYIKH